ncbi:MAG: hypothetical protein FWE95_10320 [Planctomycetaceae bacterium]|nr:hypothetical protein [Planctomycetaceae bacterium]
MLRQAYERVRILENDLHHYQRLFDRNYITQDQVDVAERELEKARNALEVVRANVDLPIIKAYSMGNNNLEEAYQVVKEHIGDLSDVRLAKEHPRNMLLVLARAAEHAKVMELLEPFVANRPGTTASTPLSPALYAPLPVDPEYLALLQKRVEVAKMVLEEARVREGVRTARFAEAELALLEAEFMLKQAQTQRAGDEGTP